MSHLSPPSSNAHPLPHSLSQPHIAPHLPALATSMLAASAGYGVTASSSSSGGGHSSNLHPAPLTLAPVILGKNMHLLLFWFIHLILLLLFFFGVSFPNCHLVRRRDQVSIFFAEIMISIVDAHTMFSSLLCFFFCYTGSSSMSQRSES